MENIGLHAFLKIFWHGDQQTIAFGSLLTLNMHHRVPTTPEGNRIIWGTPFGLLKGTLFERKWGPLGDPF